MMVQLLVRQCTSWAYAGDTFVRRWRAARMHAMLRLVRVPRAARIIDLGGSPYVWDLFNHDFRVTLVNLPGSVVKISDRYSLVEADACDLSAVFADQSFDLVFSNSVIEHVGNDERQAALAREVRRLAPAYWVQTPSDCCPVEAHTGVPYYWRLPAWLRDHMLRKWESRMPVWTQMIANTRVLSRRRMEDLFPDARLYCERRFGFEKSYAAYRAWVGGERAESRVHRPY